MPKKKKPVARKARASKHRWKNPAGEDVRRVGAHIVKKEHDQTKNVYRYTAYGPDDGGYKVRKRLSNPGVDPEVSYGQVGTHANGMDVDSEAAYALILLAYPDAKTGTRRNAVIEIKAVDVPAE